MGQFNLSLHFSYMRVLVLSTKKGKKKEPAITRGIGISHHNFRNGRRVLQCCPFHC